MQPAEYQKLANLEDTFWYFETLHRHVERELVRHLGADAPAKVLDAGCGTGGLIRRLHRRRPNWQWTGVDLAPEACEFARAKATPAHITRASVTALPFATETFDAVTSLDVLYHLADDVTALREAHRVLRPGGEVVINAPAHPWLWSYHDEAVAGLRRYTHSDLVTKLRVAGFEAVKTTHWNLLPLPLIVLRRKIFPKRSGASDVEAVPPMAEWMLSRMMRIESGWLGAGRRLPAGCSILAVARKSA
ncbi:MAG TPA: class I SAM-dependent methyltransferase [Candidatus Synoicihabitans sp.]|nr:class I SAM-dependent methyltransferase [Candidatus Synoicihabitans sp.]